MEKKIGRIAEIIYINQMIQKSGYIICGQLNSLSNNTFRHSLIAE